MGRGMHARGAARGIATIAAIAALLALQLVPAAAPATSPATAPPALEPGTIDPSQLAADGLFDIEGQFWARGITGANMTIAILDTGIGAGHEVFAGKQVHWTDVTTDAHGTPVDLNGHGTACASVAAGNASGFKGYAPGSNIAAVKMFVLQDGSPAAENEDAANATTVVIENALAWNVKVASLSWNDDNQSDGSDELSRIVERLVDAGIVTVVAAGNTAGTARQVTAPGTSAMVLTVGAFDPARGTVPSFSRRGPTADGRIKPDVIAPGTGVPVASHLLPDGYITMAGTSIATPAVAGMATLLLERFPVLDHRAVKHLFCVSALETRFTGGHPDNDEGWGLVNPAGAAMIMDNQWDAGTPRTFMLDTGTPATRSFLARVSLPAGDHRISLVWANLSGDAGKVHVHVFDATGDEHGTPRLLATSRGSRVLASLPAGEYIVAVKPEPSTWLAGGTPVSGNFTLSWTPTTEMAGAMAWGWVLACTGTALGCTGASLLLLDTRRGRGQSPAGTG